MQNRDSIDAVLEASQRCWDLASQLMNEAAAAFDLWAIVEEAEHALLEVLPVLAALTYLAGLIG